MELISLVQQGHLWAFLVLVVGIIALPGTDMAFVMGNTLAGGRSLGTAAISGIVAGGMVHSVMAYLGIGIVLETVPWAFSVMLFAGAIYLAWIGVQMFRMIPATEEAASVAVQSHRRTVVQGMITCLLNPKAYFFMFAIFPQFIRPQDGSLELQIIVLGTIIAAVQIIIYGGTAWSVVKVFSRMNDSRNVQVQVSRGLGVLLISLAALSVARVFWGG